MIGIRDKIILNHKNGTPYKDVLEGKTNDCEE